MFELVIIGKGKRSTIYSVKFDDSDDTEFYKFLNDPSVQNEVEFEEFLKKIELIKDKYGCQEQLFEYDSTFSNDVCKLKRGKLRLYCCRYSGIILILGDGGIKENYIKRTQDNDHLLSSMTRMKSVSDKIENCINNEELKINTNINEFETESGDLHFE